MKKSKEEKLFIRIADAKLVEEVLEECSIGHRLPFEDLFYRYQQKHIKKYNKVLTLKSKK